MLLPRHTQCFPKLCRLVFSVRYSTQGKLKNEELISQLSRKKSGEDIASYVRFNREANIINAHDYAELYSRAAHPNATDYELEERRLRIEQICAEYEYTFAVNMRAPSSLSIENMRILLGKDTPEQRQIYLLNCYVRDYIQIRKGVHKVVKANEKQQFPFTPIHPSMLGCFAPNGDLQYGLWRNSLFSRYCDYRKQRIKSSLSAAHLGQKVIFDWSFPVKLMPEDQEGNIQGLDEDPLMNRVISERSYKVLCSLIINIYIKNTKLSHLCHPPLNFLHYNMDKNSKFYHHFQEAFDMSELTRKFFDAYPNSYLDHFTDKQIIYISPFADKTLTQEDLNQQVETVFVFNPFTELFGLRKRTLKQLFLMKQTDEQERNVQFRRLPAHLFTLTDYVPLEHYLNYLKDILQDGDWTKALLKNLPKKYFRRKEKRFVIME